jgi:hypothetical protein
MSLVDDRVLLWCSSDEETYCRLGSSPPGRVCLPHFADYGRAVAAMVPASMAGEYARTLQGLTLISAAQRPPPR